MAPHERQAIRRELVDGENLSDITRKLLIGWAMKRRTTIDRLLREAERTL